MNAPQRYDPLGTVPKTATMRTEHSRLRYGVTDPFYKKAAWLKFRAVIKRRDPVCRRCLRAPTTTVDHITPMSEGGKPLDPKNAQGLCTSCHGVKTQEDIARRRRNEDQGDRELPDSRGASSLPTVQAREPLVPDPERQLRAIVD